MKIGDLVKVNNRCSAALWGNVEHLFDYYSLDIINENR